jgi:hypothetical protein
MGGKGVSARFTKFKKDDHGSWKWWKKIHYSQRLKHEQHTSRKIKKPVYDFARKPLTAPTSFIFRNCVVNLRIIYQQTTLWEPEEGEEGEEGEDGEEDSATNAEEKGTGWPSAPPEKMVRESHYCNW